jgi:hypothetical protein
MAFAQGLNGGNYEYVGGRPKGVWSEKTRKFYKYLGSQQLPNF